MHNPYKCLCYTKKYYFDLLSPPYMVGREVYATKNNTKSPLLRIRGKLFQNHFIVVLEKDGEGEEESRTS